MDTKSNEITAVPELLGMLDLEGHTVSLDAMGCQKNITRKLHLAHADYLLAVKGNHPRLHERLEQLFGSGTAVAICQGTRQHLLERYQGKPLPWPFGKTDCSRH